MDIFEGREFEAEKFKSKPLASSVENLKESRQVSERKAFNKVFDIQGERIAKINTTIEKGVINQKYSPSEFVNSLLDTKKVKPSDFLKIYDNELQETLKSQQFPSSAAFAASLINGSLDNGELNTGDVLSSMVRNFGVDRTYVLANEIELIVEPDINSRVIDITAKVLSGADLARLLK